MSKIYRFRPLTNITMEDFINDTIDKGCCSLCKNKHNCQQEMKLQTIDDLKINECKGFDTDVEQLEQYYIQNQYNIEKLNL